MNNLIKKYVELLYVEGKVGASPEYLKKEKVREALQSIISGLVKDGQVKDEDDLKETFSNVDLALKSLKMIPLDVWKKL